MRKYFLSFLISINCFFLFAQLVPPMREQKINMPVARFKTGDDKIYREAALDDSKWQIVKTNEPWDEQGFENYDGFVWYRIHVTIPSSLKKQSFWKDSLRIYMAKIDDADEVYLNGVLVGKKGSFPTEAAGYITKWDEEREYHISTSNPAIRWDKDRKSVV